MSVKFTSYKSQRINEINLKKKRALEACGGTAERYTKENLTKNKSVISNTLRGSITHQQRDENTEAIGTGVKYAPYVELGHHQEPGRYVAAIGKRLVKSWVPAKPYLRPAIEEHQDEYARIIKSELEL